MKKLLACGLILAMLSSTGAMCFASEEVEIVSTIQVFATEVEAIEESQDNKTSQEELLSDIEAIKSNKSLTVKEKLEKAWDSVKEFVEGAVRPDGKLARAWNFVKEHYIAVGGAIAAAVVIPLLVWLCGPSVVDALKSLFSSDNEKTELEECENKAEQDHGEISKMINEINSKIDASLEYVKGKTEEKNVIINEEAERITKKQAEEERVKILKSQEEKIEKLQKELSEQKESNKRKAAEERLAKEKAEKEKKEEFFKRLINKLDECKKLINESKIDDAQFVSADALEALEEEPSLKNLADEFYNDVQTPLNDYLTYDKELGEDIIDKIDAMIEKFKSFQK